MEKESIDNEDFVQVQNPKNEPEKPVTQNSGPKLVPKNSFWAQKSEDKKGVERIKDIVEHETIYIFSTELKVNLCEGTYVTHPTFYFISKQP